MYPGISCCIYVIMKPVISDSSNRLTHVGIARECLAAERLCMCITMTDETSDEAHRNMTKVKYIPAKDRTILINSASRIGSNEIHSLKIRQCEPYANLVLELDLETARVDVDTLDQNRPTPLLSVEGRCLCLFSDESQPS